MNAWHVWHRLAIGERHGEQQDLVTTVRGTELRSLEKQHPSSGPSHDLTTVS